MNSEKAKRTYTAEEVEKMIEKAIRQDREFTAQVLRTLPFVDIETKQGWIENPKALAEALLQLCPSKQEKKARPAPQHLYEFTICKTGATTEGFQKYLDEEYFVSDYAKGMIGKPEYTIGPAEENVLIRVYRVDALGVKGWSETDFFGPKGWKHLEKLGLLKCLPDDAPCIREAHNEQKLNEWIMVAHDPISAYSSFWVFTVACDGDHGRCFSGRYLLSECRLRAVDLVAVRVAS